MSNNIGIRFLPKWNEIGKKEVSMPTTAAFALPYLVALYMVSNPYKRSLLRSDDEAETK